MKRSGPAAGIWPPLCCVILAATCLGNSGLSRAQDSARLQQLLRGEALFFSHQQDYVSAISRLQLSENQGLVDDSPESTRLLLAQMKLAYGMDLEAGFDLHSLLGDGVPSPVKNRAWYELARTFSHKGYHRAAWEALQQVRGELPADITGDHQLLSATVLMALDRDLDAARALEEWRGEPKLAAYAHYNRGIALLRAGEYQQVVPILKKAVRAPARSEELLSLRDKSRLSLSYIYAREEAYTKARRQLQAVRPDGPYSNRALLALGWIAYKRGHSEEALVTWTELRGRPATDPAVLETLLVVPAVNRELDAMQTAVQDYETAVSAYNEELGQVQVARSTLQDSPSMAPILQHGGRSENLGNGPGEATRYLGPLFASRKFSELRRGHGELTAMLGSVENGLREMDQIEAGSPGRGSQALERAAAPLQPPTTAAPEGGQVGSPARPETGPDGQLQPQSVRVEHEGLPAEQSTDNIPPLPEINSPALRPLKALPEPELTSKRIVDHSRLPPPSVFIKQAPSPEIFGMPESRILWLPKSGEFFRRPGEIQDEDYAYPDAPSKNYPATEGYGYQLSRLLRTPPEKSAFDPGAVPVGNALRDLAAAFNDSRERMMELDGASDPGWEVAGLDGHKSALRERILKLKLRITQAINLYEENVRALALDELDRRQFLLEDLLQQASLELAKTYDQRGDQ